ncbi:hypothetical protein IMG5_004610 [Ichthyophthirius multifiliis]|uniref:GB1/RHD3-type G domain-containing protein n=1 Tax=Ichthyophthirius multifiliis TaxID=5932 RepID=G0QJE6_ICHMU|nr:hypothetical protein IMG5_004610 [Ichthyophthirius multifiliis]EGR34658.1 hypothetical protein IMG5_004610 [Ichthyophthirius multifiliis]|eukprot:XP_004039962.1 hypothetical protein IMG5_004610 [Ichthyophthirius multifiliis]
MINLKKVLLNKQQNILKQIINKDYKINPDSINFIKQLQKPISIITVAGLYRTGKSYLLNTIIQNKNAGFQVGSTINSCTKGIWIYGCPIKETNLNGENINILVLDCEGMGSTNESQDYENKLFCLCILLSSSLIYNSMNAIDENAINKLFFISNITKNIQLKQDNIDQNINEDDYQKYFPNFYWVLRDFTLQLVDKQGNQITSNQYFEQSLQEQKGISDEVQQKNRIKKFLKQFFTQRECVTLVRPLESEQDLQKLDQIEFQKLRPEFQEQIEQFRKRIIKKSKPKMINNKYLNGEMFLSLAESYLLAINTGKMLNIGKSWEYVCKLETSKAVQKSFEKYEQILKQKLYPIIPTTCIEIKVKKKKNLYKNAYFIYIYRNNIKMLKKKLQIYLIIQVQEKKKMDFWKCQKIKQKKELKLSQIKTKRILQQIVLFLCKKNSRLLKISKKIICICVFWNLKRMCNFFISF